VLVKPQHGCRVLLPDDKAAARVGAGAEIPANGRTSNIVNQTFNPGPAGPARFKSYIAMSVRRFDLIHMAVECRIKDAATGRTLAEGRFAFPSSVTLGPNHYVPFALDCPAAPSVNVELAVALRRTSWQPNPISFRWWDSRIEAGGGAPGIGGAAQATGAVKRTELEMVRLEGPLVALTT